MIGSRIEYRNPRFQTIVLGGFAALALVLTALGVFAVVAFVVASRTRELSIRLALGAEPASLAGLMLRHALIPAGIGAAIGLAATQWLDWALGRLAVDFPGVEPLDPVLLVTVAGIVAATAFLAAWIPARRAARVDPAIVLKAD